jgi:hypothetical protein
MRLKHREIHVGSIKTRIKGPHCPRCGGDADGGTGFGNRTKVQPRKGDIAICLYCGSFNVYLADLTQREMTAEELRKLEADPAMAELVELAACAALKWRRGQL